jgi:hypothetical protein
MRIWVKNYDQKLKKLPICISVALLLIGVAPPVFAAGPTQLSYRYDKISTSAASSISQHEIGFIISELSIPVGSISIDFCSNSPLIEVACTPPSGFDASSANLNSSQGETGFSIGPGSTANRIILTRPASLPTGAVAVFTFSNIMSPASNGSYYVRLQTFTSTDGSGLPIQYGGLVFAVASPLSITTEVPPYLVFCVGVTIVGTDCSTINSYFIDVGELSTQTVRAASSEFAVATNAPSGYSITISGATLTSGSRIIPAITPPGDSIPGTSQFGLNLRANTNPSIGNEPTGYLAGTVAAGYATPNKFQFTNNDTLVTATNTSDYEKFTVSYITNVSSAQAAGIYTTTMTYIALANF